MITKLDINNLQEETRIDAARIHMDSITDLRKPVARPPLAISIGMDDMEYNGVRYPLRFATFGNISLIKGEEKTRKSFAKSLLLACAIGGKANNYSDKIQGYLGDKWLIDIDSEQSEYDAWLNAVRIPKMVGAYPENYLSIQLRKYSVDERRAYLEWLFMESQYRNNLGLVFIDGYVDFVKDFNSQEQSSEFTQKLLTYSSVTNCHISGILHLNFNSTKGRGHLGTILQQKCETIVIVKDAGVHSEFTCQRGRGKGFEEFSFSVDKDWLPYEVDAPINNNIPVEL